MGTRDQGLIQARTGPTVPAHDCARQSGAMAPKPTDEDYRRLLQLRTGLRRFLRWSERRARAANLTPAQHQLLLAVRGHTDPRGPTLGEVADYLVLRHHSAVGLVDRAEASGLLTRVADPDNLRVVRLHLTDEGSRQLDVLSEQHWRSWPTSRPRCRRCGKRSSGIRRPAENKPASGVATFGPAIPIRAPQPLTVRATSRRRAPAMRRGAAAGRPNVSVRGRGRGAIRGSWWSPSCSSCGRGRRARRSAGVDREVAIAAVPPHRDLGRYDVGVRDVVQDAREGGVSVREHEQRGGRTDVPDGGDRVRL